MAKMDLDQYQIMYDVEAAHWWYRSLRRVITTYFLKHLPSRVRILDAGSGTGMNAVYLQNQGKKVVAVDLSPAAVRLSRTRGLNAKVGDITRLKFPANSFDGVLCCDVLGTISRQKDRQQVIRSFHRLLKPNGRVFLHVAALPWLFSSHDRVTHIATRFTTAELTALFPEEEWHMERLSFRYFFLFPVIALAKWIDTFTSQHQSHLQLPSLVVNELLNLVMTLEDKCLRWWNFPIGSSLMVIARKKILIPKKGKLPSLTIFFPFYNDEGTVEKALRDAYHYGKQVARQLEVIALHGGNSRDGTWQKIQTARKKYPKLKVINKKQNTEGYAVIKHGFRAATKEWVFYTDGDLQYDLADLPQVVHTQLATGADIVNGYKTRRKDNLFRRVGGEVYRQLSHRIFHLPIRDVDCDFRLIRRQVMKQVPLKMAGASVLTELIGKLQRKNAHFAEVPVHHRARTYGTSNYTTFSLLKEKIWGDLRVWWYLRSH